MVVLTEEFHGLSLKRKGAHEPGLFHDAGDRSSGFSLSCRATKMRRLACPDGPRDGDDDQAAVGGAATAAWEDDVAMGDAAAAPSPSPGAVGDDDGRAVVVYGDGGSSRRIDAPRLRADWIRAMLREADSRTVRELLAGAALERGSESDLALAVVPWVAPTAEEAAAEEASDGEDGAAAMDVEGDDEGQEGGRPWTWTGHGQAYGDVAGEGLVYRWPQHCWAAPVPAVAQASPVMWSW
jgi:hypothetical protein